MVIVSVSDVSDTWTLNKNGRTCSLLEYDAPPHQHTNNTCLVALGKCFDSYIRSSSFLDIHQFYTHFLISNTVICIDLCL